MNEKQNRINSDTLPAPADDEVLVCSETAADFAALFAQVSPEEVYLTITTMAARLEQQGEFSSAAHYWDEAHQVARTHLDRHWCEIRAQRCICQARWSHGDAN